MNLDETIIAVSAPRGSSFKTLIRICGPCSFDGCQRVFELPPVRMLEKRQFSLRHQSVPVLVAAFGGDQSYTGQDTVELQCPNNPYLVERMIQHLIDETGGRLAEAGEFTARAFFNGRLSLSEAEGVCATISASNDAELKGATLLREGALASRVEFIATTLARTLGLVEAGIDFTDEEDVVAITEEELTQEVKKCIQSICAILDNNISMASLHALPLVVIAGKPNAGKSTLFNALVGFDRVVVNSEEGTTRDAITERVHFGTREAELVDIAGIEQSVNAVSDAAQKKTASMMQKADVVLYCVAPQQTVPKACSNYLVIHTKGDEEHSKDGAISAVSGQGIYDLKESVAGRLGQQLNPNEHALALLGRHEQLLVEAKRCLEQAEMDVRVTELAANSLRNALNAIGGITGQVTPDEVLGEVFSSFCVGK